MDYISAGATGAAMTRTARLEIVVAAASAGVEIVGSQNAATKAMARTTATGRDAICGFEKIIVRSPICLISKFNKPDSGYRQTIILKNDMELVVYRKSGLFPHFAACQPAKKTMSQRADRSAATKTPGKWPPRLTRPTPTPI
ncbi:hypothetical protein [Novosphingobium sp.]|jgi:hypothetical protein|uniref:hypothetical protein n=1 Tax=Novosphingobium sp. TaxID=1874826 RepID=UPI002FDFF6FB